MSDRKYLGSDLAKSDSSDSFDSSRSTVVTIMAPGTDLEPVMPPMDRVDICGANDCGDVMSHDIMSRDEAAYGNVLPFDIGDRVYPPGSSLASLLVSKGSAAVTPVLPNGVQWLQAGRRYAAYKGNTHLGGIDPVATGDPSSPLWVAYAKGNRNEVTHDSLISAMEWVMENAEQPGRLITDILQEQIGPINLKLDRDGYRIALRHKGSDNQLCIYMFDNRNSTSQELRVNIGLIPKEPMNAIAWLDTMIKGLKAGLQLYRDWANVPGIEVRDEDDPDPKSIRGSFDFDESFKSLELIRRKPGNSYLTYSPPQPEQVIEVDPLAASAMPPVPDLDKAADDERDGKGHAIDPRGGPMDGITFTPHLLGGWDEDDEEQE